MAPRCCRHHAVVNDDSGAPAANRIVRVPAASDRENWVDLQHKLVADAPGRAVPPRLFDGDALPALADAPDFWHCLLRTERASGGRWPCWARRSTCRRARPACGCLACQG